MLWNPDTKAAYFSRLKQLVEKYNNQTRSWLEDEVWALKERIAVDARADAALWHTTNDFDAAVHALVEQVRGSSGSAAEDARLTSVLGRARRLSSAESSCTHRNDV